MRRVPGRPGLAAALLLALLPVLVFGRALVPGRVLSPADNLLQAYPWRQLAPGLTPANPELVDVTFMFHPWLLYAAREIRHGHFPLWNPYAFAGAPFFGNAQTALLFPLHVLAYLLPARVALALMAMAKVGAAGLAMYWFLRVLALGRAAAFLGGLAFMLNGALIVWLQWSYSSSILFVPLLLGAAERLRERRGAWRVAAFALVIALDVFAGYPQAAFVGLVAASAWALARAGGAERWFFARYAGGVALGVLLSAVQLLPFLEYLRESAVLAYRADWMPVLSIPFRSAITFLMPYYYGSPTGGDFWGPWNFNEISLSVGLVPWVLLPVALVLGWRRPGTIFFTALAIVAAAILYGAPLVVAAEAALPIRALVPNYRLAAPLLIVSLCALGAIGVDRLVDAGPGPRRAAERAVKVWFAALAGLALLSLVDDYATIARQSMKVSVSVQYEWFLLLLTLVAVVAVRALRGVALPRGWPGALVLVQLASAAPLALTYTPVIDARWFYPTPAALQYLERERAADGGRVLLSTNVPMLYGLPDVAGYDGMTPRRLERVLRPGGAFTLLGNGSLTTLDVFRSSLVDFLGIRHVVVPPASESPGPAYSLVYDGPDARVYRNEHALPRAFLVDRARCVGDREALALIAARAVDLGREVLLGDCAGTPPAGPPLGRREARVRDDAADRVLIEATTDAPAYLVLSDTWFPGWQVRVDGEESALRRADYAFRAVALSAGRHDVEFRYRPASFRLGLVLTVVAACLAGGLALGPGLRAAAAR